MESTGKDQPKVDREVIIVAWITMLLPSTISVIIWNKLVPVWWFWLTAMALGVIITLTFLRVNLRPLRGFALILFTIFFFGYGGGWEWGLIPLIRSNPFWLQWENGTPMNIGHNRRGFVGISGLVPGKKPTRNKRVLLGVVHPFLARCVHLFVLRAKRDSVNRNPSSLLSDGL